MYNCSKILVYGLTSVMQNSWIECYVGKTQIGLAGNKSIVHRCRWHDDRSSDGADCRMVPSTSRFGCTMFTQWLCVWQRILRTRSEGRIKQKNTSCQPTARVGRRLTGETKQKKYEIFRLITDWLRRTGAVRCVRESALNFCSDRWT
jgi:hypothetical protein